MKQPQYGGYKSLSVNNFDCFVSANKELTNYSTFIY